MKSWKKKSSLLIVPMLAVLGLGLTESIVSNAEQFRESDQIDFRDYLRIPNNLLADEITSNLNTDIGDEDLYWDYRLLKKSIFDDQRLDIFYGPSGHASNEMGFTSLEGIQVVHADRIELAGQFYDLTPLSEITDVKILRLSLGYDESIFENITPGISDLSFMKKMQDIEEVRINQNAYEYSDRIYGSPIIDLSELNGKEKLNNIDISVGGALPVISLKEGYRKHELFDPIILSEQFSGEEASLIYTSEDPFFTNEDGLLQWTDIPVGTEKLSFRVEASNYIEEGDKWSNYHGDIEIPIVWK